MMMYEPPQKSISSVKVHLIDKPITMWFDEATFRVLVFKITTVLKDEAGKYSTFYLLSINPAVPWGSNDCSGAVQSTKSVLLHGSK